MARVLKSPWLWLVVSAGALFFMGWAVAPGVIEPVAKWLGELFARGSAETDATRRTTELFLVVGLLVAALGTSLLATLLKRPIEAAIGLAVTTLIAALALADAPDFFAGLAKAEVIHEGATMLAELTARGVLALVLVVAASLVLWRADRLVYVVSVVAMMAAATLLLGAATGVLGSFRSVQAEPTTSISITGELLGAPPSSESGEITVLFIRPTVSAEGATTGYTHHRWTGTVEDPVVCGAKTCRVSLVVKRGASDADLGALLADRAAATATYLIVPEPAGSPSPSPGQ
jgi:hypothetical protein